MRGWHRVVRSRYLLAIGIGLLWAAAYPKLNWAGLGWLVPGLLLLSTTGLPGTKPFGIGYVAGLAHYLASLYWLLFIPYPGTPIIGWLALSGYLALYPAVWVWLCWKLLPAPPSPSLPWRQFIPQTRTWQRCTWALLCAVLWTALEMVRARLFTGFPWNALAVSQHQMLPLIQIASLVGMYGISFLIVWVSISLIFAILVLMDRPTERWLWLYECILPLGTLLLALTFGFWQLAHPLITTRALRTALVQPAIPQTVIWDQRESTNRFLKLLQLSHLALTAKPDLLVWPEGAVPNLLRYDPEFTYPAITQLARQNRVWIILCADDAEPRPGSHQTNDYEFFNSSFLISPNGELRSSYHKQQLVVFGEYVPLVKWLPFLKWFTPVTGGFTPGKQPVTFDLPNLNVRTSVLICFEDVFPHVTRRHVQPGIDFLLNLTNDGWFDESAAQWQHTANALLRTVENGLPLVCCSNNGLTCWIDANGRLLDVFGDNSKDVYGTGFKIVQIPLPKLGQLRPLTFYARYGDWFGWTCVVIAALAVVWRWFKSWLNRRMAP